MYVKSSTTVMFTAECMESVHWSSFYLLCVNIVNCSCVTLQTKLCLRSIKLSLVLILTSMMLNWAAAVSLE